MNKEYDVIVLGTGLNSRSAFSPWTASRFCTRTENDYYGGEPAPLNLCQLWKRLRGDDDKSPSSLCVNSFLLHLRDDLMTMLIAGHETTAAVLTWAVFLLAQEPTKMRKAQAEIDAVLGDENPSYESLKRLEYVRHIVIESLRLYPQPPLLIRRTLKPDVLPGGYNGDKNGYSVPAGTDIFISVYNIHRSPHFWDRPNEFEPERFLVKRDSNGIEGWSGFDPSRSLGALYPNEIISDFALLPFGGGPRKCVGDQFALMESTVALAMILQRYDLELKGSPDSVELVTGATIHTKNGLWCKLRKRSKSHYPSIFLV